MKRIFLFTAALSTAIFAAPIYMASVQDADGNSYKTVRINKQVWMAENLKTETPDSKCFDDEPGNCDIFGRLYTVEEATEDQSKNPWKKKSGFKQGICPAGWHIPSEEEFQTLLKYIVLDNGLKCNTENEFSYADEFRNESCAIRYMAEPNGWYYPASEMLAIDNLVHEEKSFAIGGDNILPTTDKYGFAFKPAGAFFGDRRGVVERFGELGQAAYMLTSSGKFLRFCYGKDKDSPFTSRETYNSYGSLRCIKD